MTNFPPISSARRGPLFPCEACAPKALIAGWFQSSSSTARMPLACWRRSPALFRNHGGNLLEVSQYTDVNTGWFFARLAIEKGLEHWDPDAFANAFAPGCFPVARRMVHPTRRMEDADGHPSKQAGALPRGFALAVALRRAWHRSAAGDFQSRNLPPIGRTRTNPL